MRIKLIYLFLTVSFLPLSAATFGQKITLKKEHSSLKGVLREIKKQSGYDFVYRTSTITQANTLSIDVTNVTLRDALEASFNNQPFTYIIEDKVIIINDKPLSTPVRKQGVITGIILDENKKPLSGANVVIKGSKVNATTDIGGKFSLQIISNETVLIVSYIGYITQEVAVNIDQPTLTINMKVNENNMQDIVITGTGINRNKNSFTGATATFTGAELKMVGNQNIIKSLRALDPSFLQIENNLQGSNPNALPTIELRGQTSLSTEGVRDQFSTDPNQPLYILDGFETTLRMIVDLDMNMVSSITILKDAASTALYGSRASNGVVVVETLKPIPGKVNLTYTTDMQIELPDLSSYNMMNATEKLEFERLAGRYTDYYGVFPQIQLNLDDQYAIKLAEVQRGVNTYWLNEPLQTGVSQRHAIRASGGEDALRFNIGANYKKTTGTMKGSERDDWGGDLTLYYRTGKVNISNRTYINGYTGIESPYGNFQTFVNTNPYYRKKLSTERYLDQTTNANNGVLNIENPLYNAALNSFDNTKNLGVLNNTQINYDLTPEIRLQASLQLNQGTTEATNFVSPLNTQFDGTDISLKGTYDNIRTKSSSWTAFTMATYAKVFNNVHSFTANVRAEASEQKNSLLGVSAIGFPSSSNGNPSFSYGYPNSEKPTSLSRTTRRNSLIGSANYSYDRRFNFDLSLNVDGSTAFGANNKYAPYYSGGVSWNLNNENFIKDISWINLLRVRANIGVTGNQNFGTVSESIYDYTSVINRYGQGVYLTELGNANLEWQSTTQTSFGIDATLFGNRLNIQLNAYQKTTDPLVVAITLPSSTGLSSYPFNAGANEIKGFEGVINIFPIYKPEDRIIWGIGLTTTLLQQEYSKFDNKLDALNTELKESNSLTRYRDGYSPTAIWAVPSLGIDPATGRELFLTKDGQYSFDYDINNIQVVGDSRPKAEGVFRSNLSYKGFTTGFYIRYILGQDLFNSALYNKVENISLANISNNQDRRALYDRWQQPGDLTQFKNIANSSTTPMSSRFVQKQNTISGESINLGYEFTGRKWMNSLMLSNLKVTGFMNDIFYLSTIQRERGTNYPFARSFSFSLNATFK